MWQERLLTYDELKGLGWEWQSMDGSMVKAPLAREAAGRNPTDRGKKRTKRSVAVESRWVYERSKMAYTKKPR
jgi:hypothetical protein